MQNAFTWCVLGVTYYSGNSRCGKVFERVWEGTLVKNPSGAGRRSLRWETSYSECKEALAWTCKSFGYMKAAMRAGKKTRSSQREGLGHHCMHTCLDWVWKTPIGHCRPKAIKKARSNQRFLLTKPSSQKLTDTPLRTQNRNGDIRIKNWGLHLKEFQPHSIIKNTIQQWQEKQIKVVRDLELKTVGFSVNHN